MSVTTPPGAQPILSVLIPAYNYALGVRRIVIPLLAERHPDIEILIHDDSSDDGVESAIRGLDSFSACLRYARNSPSLGAVRNWNSLLQSARGRYVILIHHDDFPLSENFASELLGELERRDWPDAIILSCLAYNAARRKVTPCICNRFRLFVGKRYPAYLFRRNVIGPPSVLVVRRDLFEGYDPALNWLVDVEAYFRFLTAQARSLFLSPLMMASSTDLPDAISGKIKDRVGEITDAELAYLETKYPRSGFWAKLRGKAFAWKILLALERLLWGSVRTACALHGALTYAPSLSAAVIHRDRAFESIARAGNATEKRQ